MRNEYNNMWLRREGSLVSSFYHHLRKRFKKSFFIENNLRIYTEYGLPGGYRIDMVVAQLNEDWDDVEEILVIIEFKYKGKYASWDLFHSDVQKIGELRKLPFLANTYFYFANIQEEYWSKDERISWLDGRQKRWARGRLTELNGFFDETKDVLVTEVIEH